jgi:hypothetical protein
VSAGRYSGDPEWAQHLDGFEAGPVLEVLGQERGAPGALRSPKDKGIPKPTPLNRPLFPQTPAHASCTAPTNLLFASLKAMSRKLMIPADWPESRMAVKRYLGQSAVDEQRVRTCGRGAD